MSTRSSLLYLCINLPDCHERRISMEHEAKIAEISIQFVDGIDGRKGFPELGERIIKPAGMDFQTYQLTSNQVGCILSHCRALEQFLASTFDYAVIFEDDAKLCDNFAEAMKELLSIKGWDCVKLESRKKKPRGVFFKNLNNGTQLHCGTKTDDSATALLWSRKGATEALRSFRVLSLPYDVHLARYSCWKIKTLEAFPPLVTQKDYPSNISKTEQSIATKNYRKKSLMRAFFQAQWSLYRHSKAAFTWLHLHLNRR